MAREETVCGSADLTNAAHGANASWWLSDVPHQSGYETGGHRPAHGVHRHDGLLPVGLMSMALGLDRPSSAWTNISVTWKPGNPGTEMH